MFDRLKREGGFTLIEIVVILAVIAIISAAMVPRISGIMDDAKISRAQSEVQTIGMAILRFNANTGRWPARDVAGSDNQVVSLESGIYDAQVTPPAYGGADGRWTDSTADYFDNHLANNTPGRPSTASYTGTAYPITGLNRWNGPYLQEVAADPWGNGYRCNIVAAYSTDVATDLYCYIISAGPNGTIETDGQVETAEVAAHQVSGDDVAFLLRARQ